MVKKKTKTTICEQTLLNIVRARQYASEVIDSCNEFCEERQSRIDGDTCKDCPGARLNDEGERSGECIISGLGDTLDDIIELIREAEEMEKAG